MFVIYILNITSKFVNSKFGFHQLPFLELHSQNYPWFHTYKNVGANQHTLKSGKQIPTTTYKLNIIYITNKATINHYIHVTQLRLNNIICVKYLFVKIKDNNLYIIKVIVINWQISWLFSCTVRNVYFSCLTLKNLTIKCGT
jgi:hypothetical protein